MKKINIGLLAAFVFVLVVVISSLSLFINNSYGDAPDIPKEKVLEETAKKESHLWLLLKMNHLKKGN